MADLRFEIVFDSNGVPVIRQLQQEASALGMTVADTATRTSGAWAQMERTALSLHGVLVGVGAALSVQQLVEYADTWSLIEGRLKLVTTSTAELQQVQEALFGIAQDTRTSLEGTADLYTRLARSSQELGLSQRDLLQITETINQAMLVSGTSAQSARAALVQLGQALAAGALRGEELNSVLEQAPRLAQAIAAGMEVTVGELRTLGEEGALTADAVVHALRTQRDVIAQEFRQLPQTVGQSVTQVGNAFLRLVGTMDATVGASQALAAAISLLADNFDVAAVAVGAFAATAVVANLSAITRAVQSLTVAVGALNVVLAANPWVIVATGISLGATAAYTLISALTELGKKTNEFAKQLNVVADASDVTWVPISEGAALSASAIVKLVETTTRYDESARAAAAAAQELAKAQERASKAAVTQLAELQAVNATLRKAVEDHTDLATAMALVEQVTLHARTGNVNLTQALTQARAEQERLLGTLKERQAAHDAAAQAAERDADAQRRLAESYATETETLERKLAVLARAVAGSIEMAEAQRQIAAITEEAKGHTAEHARRLAELQARERDLTRALEEQRAAIDEQFDALSKRLSREKEAVEATEAQIAAQERETALITQGIAAGRAYDDILRDLAIAKQQAALEAQGLTQNVRETATAMVDSAREAERARVSLEAYKDSFTTVGAVVAESAREMVSGILLGTREAEDLLGTLKDLVIGTFADMFATTLEHKLAWEVQLSSNLLNDLPALFGHGGALAGQSLITSLFGGLAQAGGVGAIVGSLLGTGAGVGAGLGSLANSFGFLSSELAGIGVSLGTTLANSFGVGISTALGIGGAVSNLILPGIGLLAGFLFEEFFGGLFAHTPTKGTQIRKGVIEFLEDIEVSFASELESGDYFFDETKALAEKMLGGDFLAASKQILTEKAGPELARQLQALGTVITAESAIELGKSLEQTGTTFGNLLIDNLGLEAIPAALDEIINKAGIDFASAVATLGDAFQQGAIGAEFYAGAIEGAVDLFFSDLPAAIDVSRLALESFTDDGLLSLTAFEEKLRAATTTFTAVGTAAGNAWTQGFSEGLSGEEVAHAFLEQLKQIQAAELIEEQRAALDLFAGIDLSQPITAGSEAADLLAERLRVAYENTLAILDAAGLLPKAFTAAADATTQWREDIEHAAKEMRLFAGTEPIEVPVEFVHRATGRAEDLATQIEGQITSGLMEAFASGNVAAAVAGLGQNLHDVVQQNMLTALTAATVLPMLQPLISGMAAAGQALADGTIDATTYAALIHALLEDVDMDALQQAMITALDIAHAVADTLNSANIGVTGTLDRTASSTPSVSPTAGGGGSVSSAPVTDPLEDFRAAVEQATSALRGFIDSAVSGTEDLASQLAQVDADLAAALTEALALTTPGNVTVGTVLDDINRQLRRFGVSISLADLDDLETVLSDLPRSVQRNVSSTVRLLDYELRQVGSSIDQLADLAEQAAVAAAQATAQLITDFLAPFEDFIARGMGSDSLAVLTAEYTALVASLEANRTTLAAAGQDVDAILTDMADSLLAQFERLRTELLDPVQQAIADLLDTAPANLESFLSQIAGAKTVEELQRISDDGTRAIVENLQRQQDAARAASEERIAQLNAERDAARAALQEQERSLSRLIDLRTQLIEEELRGLDEAAGAAQRMGDVAAEIREQLDALRVGPQSFLAPTAQAEEAARQFREALAAGLAGDADAAQRAAQLGRSAIDLFRQVFASGAPSLAFAAEVESGLALLADTLEQTSTQQLSHIALQRQALESQLLAADHLAEIADLTAQLGLTGSESLAQLDQLRQAARSQLDVFAQGLDSFSAAIAAEEATLTAALESMEEAAVIELQSLQEALSRRFDELIAETQRQTKALTEEVQALTEEVGGQLTVVVETPDGKRLEEKIFTNLWRKSSAGQRVIHVRGVFE